MSDRSGVARPSGWVVAAILLGGVGLVYLLRFVLLPLAFALALAYVLQPLVDSISVRGRLPRLVAVLFVFSAVVAGTVALVWWLVFGLGPDLIEAASAAPMALSAALQRLFGPAIQVLDRTVTPDGAAHAMLESAGRWLLQPVALLAAGSLLVAAPAALVLTLVLLFFFLQSGRELGAGVLRLAPPRHRAGLQAHYRRIHPMLYDYMRGLGVIVLYAASVAWLVLGLVFRLPHAAAFAIAVGFFELVPVVGPAATLAMTGVAALLHGGGLWGSLGLMLFAVGLRLSIDEVVGPLVLGRAVTLHPVVIILAFLIAASLFGVLGVLFAVPVAASIKIVLAAVYGDEPLNGHGPSRSISAGTSGSSAGGIG